jgi:hypothetical protein
LIYRPSCGRLASSSATKVTVDLNSLTNATNLPQLLKHRRRRRSNRDSSSHPHYLTMEDHTRRSTEDQTRDSNRRIRREINKSAQWRQLSIPTITALLPSFMPGTHVDIQSDHLHQRAACPT